MPNGLFWTGTCWANQRPAWANCVRREREQSVTKVVSVYVNEKQG